MAEPQVAENEKFETLCVYRTASGKKYIYKSRKWQNVKNVNMLQKTGLCNKSKIIQLQISSVINLSIKNTDFGHFNYYIPCRWNMAIDRRASILTYHASDKTPI
jgi:hypothetical protein